MHISRIVLDGFKSYATKTEISGFDASFNAITGLNGSGKSNILDSICFVLGITSLSHVRANSLQELIYKNGQAGIEKATVSIVFDNSNKTQSPVGYAACPEITITRQIYKHQGKNRYLINGTVVPANKVNDLLGSVSLNVNNPHFLIMQGRVTKVLNMKPPEILAMLEEATGTRMYEDKKRETQRTIDRKDYKLARISQTLQEDLEPQITKLAEERHAFARYNTVCRQLEQLQKVYVAWQFMCAEEASRERSTELELLMKDIEQNTGMIEEINLLIKRAKTDVKELESKKSEQSRVKLQALEEDLKRCDLDLAKTESDVKHVREQVRNEQKSRAEAEKNIQEARFQIEHKKTQIERINAVSGGLFKEKQRVEKELDLAKKNLEALAMGVTVNEQGVVATLTEQLRQAEVEAAACADEMHQVGIAIGDIEPSFNVKSKQLSEMESLFQKDHVEIQNQEEAVKRLRERLTSLSFDPRRVNELTGEKCELDRKMRQLRAELDNFDARNQNLVFTAYSDPYPGFDRSKVIGTVGQLFQLKDPRWARAVETAAGGRLFQVVVDTDATARDLLKYGRLHRVVTMVPLNRIRGPTVDANRLRAAQNLVGEKNIFRALDVVSFDPRLEETMKYVFGRTLIATSLDVAERVAYDRSVNTRTVSACGSTCDPSGMLSGGSHAPGPGALERLEQRRANSRELEQLKERYRRVADEMSQHDAQSELYKELSHELVVRRAEWEQGRARLANSPHAQLRDEVGTMRTKLATHRKTQTELSIRKSKIDHKLTALRARMDSAKDEYAKNAMNEIKATVERCTEAVKAAARGCRNEEVRLRELQGDIDLLSKETEEAQQRSTACCEALVELSEQLKAQENVKATRLQAKNAAALKLKQHREFINQQTTEIIRRYRVIERKQKELDEINLANQQAEHDVTKKRKEISDAVAVVRAMADEHPWIQRDRQYFGKANGDFDFKLNEPHEVGRKVEELLRLKKEMSNTVNTRAHSQANQIETQYNNLIKKRAQVMKDKNMILQTMQELDKRKEETIKAAYKRVNKDFGDIFSNLLNGASAKLQPPNGKSVIDGLEVKVSLGGVWKESLTELSGGQRSLVALSLILAMLLFKPAPIYILDEIDAALDLAHTQNIGLMIRNRFKGSQFIVVSLKDGLFSNANVLFRTTFVEGRSLVERFATKCSNKS